MNRTDKNELFEYIRMRRGGKDIKVGVIAATRVKDTIKIGWSKCNFKVGDKFNRCKGVDTAFDRAEGRIPMSAAPLGDHTQIRQFAARCVRYFKGAKSLEMPI